MAALDRTTRQDVLAALVVAVIGIAAFLPAITGGWIYDDHSLIANNPYIHSFADWPRWFVTDFWNVDPELVKLGSRILYWRPGVTATYAVDWWLGGGSPLMFHITNCVLQGLASALAYLALRRWLGRALPAFLAALIFAVHPTKAESVAWIAGRTDVICLAALLVASAGIARRLANRRGGLAMEAFGTLAAYLCKEQAIVLPCFAAVEAWVALGRPALDVAVLVKMIRAALPQAAVALGYLVARAIVMPIGPSQPPPHIAVGQHALAVLETLGRFIALAFAPHALSIQQGLVHTSHRVLVASPSYVALGAISTAGLVAAAWLTRRRAPAIAIGIAVYFVTLLPTSNVKYTSMMTLISERFLYLPLLGLAFAAGDLLARGGARFGRRIYAVAAVLASLCAIESLGRSADYRNEDAFWARELAMHPDSGLARTLAFAHYTQNRQYYAAIAVWQQDTQPYDSLAREYVGAATAVAGVLSRLTPDHDAADLERIDRFCADVLAHHAARLDLLGVRFDLENVPAALDPDFENAKPALITLRARLQSRLGHDTEAIALAEQALALCPECFSFVDAYAGALACAGRYDDALAALAVPIQAPPDMLAASRERLEAARALSEQALTETGPAALQARASELAKLELWGRAYDVLAPYADEVAEAPKAATGFAELAVRAGEPDVARRVLAEAGTAPAEIDLLVADWTAKMGWTR